MYMQSSQKENVCDQTKTLTYYGGISNIHTQSVFRYCS